MMSIIRCMPLIVTGLVFSIDSSQAGAQKSDGDYDIDRDVDGDDFLGWQAEFGSGSGVASAAISEPTSALLVLSTVAVGGVPASPPQSLNNVPSVFSKTPPFLKLLRTDNSRVP